MQDSEKVGLATPPLKPVAHKQERSQVTRQDLIDAARVIFARDGFDSARLEEIAARAGKTRGAFYANFRDKEDVFFAIFEEDLARDREKIATALSAAPTLDQRADVIAHLMAEFLHDRQRVLLNLEFKMYVIRHPQKQKRLVDLHSEMCLRCSMTHINTLLPEFTGDGLQKGLNLAMQICAIMDGLAINALFNPASLSDEQREHYLQLAVRQVVHEARKH